MESAGAKVVVHCIEFMAKLKHEWESYKTVF
jgi:hypothetical protein